MRVTLRLHSGQGRHEDFQRWYERFTDPDNITTHVLSIDIANNATTGDLTNWDTVAFWLNQMAKGWVAAILAGPPCETWSAVRFRKILNMKYPPRPLRSRTRPWGLSYLSQREYDQLDLGNQLLRVTVLFLYAAITYKIPTIMEHPSTVEDERMAPSSWLLPEIQRIMELREVTMVHFHQCMLGQVSVKPTTLLCVCAEHTTNLINVVPNGCRCNHPRGYDETDELMGRNADGTWKTAKAKTYPSDMCRLRARSLHQATEARWGDEHLPDEWSLPDEYTDFFITLDP